MGYGNSYLTIVEQLACQFELETKSYQGYLEQ